MTEPKPPKIESTHTSQQTHHVTVPEPTIHSSHRTEDEHGNVIDKAKDKKDSPDDAATDGQA